MSENNKEKVVQTTKDQVYFKALLLRELTDINLIKAEVGLGNIIVANIMPLAEKSIEDTKVAIDELCVFMNDLGGEIARLGNERLVLVPPSIKIWKQKVKKSD